MTLRQFIKYAQTIRDDMQDKPVVIYAPNGLEFEPCIKFYAEDMVESIKNNYTKNVITIKEG